jgi:hypothetical protein
LLVHDAPASRLEVRLQEGIALARLQVGAADSSTEDEEKDADPDDQVGDIEGTFVRVQVGNEDGTIDGPLEGVDVGALVGALVGAAVGSATNVKISGGLRSILHAVLIKRWAKQGAWSVQ